MRYVSYDFFYTLKTECFYYLPVNVMTNSWNHFGEVKHVLPVGRVALRRQRHRVAVRPPVTCGNIMLIVDSHKYLSHVATKYYLSTDILTSKGVEKGHRNFLFHVSRFSPRHRRISLRIYLSYWCVSARVYVWDVGVGCECIVQELVNPSQ